MLQNQMGSTSEAIRAPAVPGRNTSIWLSAAYSSGISELLEKLLISVGDLYWDTVLLKRVT
jgi:hypothetical protein